MIAHREETYQQTSTMRWESSIFDGSNVFDNQDSDGHKLLYPSLFWLQTFPCAWGWNPFGLLAMNDIDGNERMEKLTAYFERVQGLKLKSSIVKVWNFNPLATWATSICNLETCTPI